MKSTPWRLTLRVVSILILIVSITWLLFQPGFEPLIGLLTAVAGLLTSFVARPDTNEPSDQPSRNNLPNEAMAAKPSESQVIFMPSTVTHGGKMNNNDAIDKTGLRNRMLKAFDAERLELLCVDINTRLERAGSDIRVSPAVVGGRGLETIIANLIDYLDRRGMLNHLLDAVRKAQPGLV